MEKRSRVNLVVGLDVGDRWSRFQVVSMGDGEIVEEGRLRTAPQALRERFGERKQMRIALEVGPHSRWVSRQLEQLGHEVLVANAGKVALIYKNSRKHDRVDAAILARLARLDPELLYPLRHRGARAQADLAVVRSRDLLVRSRTQWINHVRGMVKAWGERLPRCTAEAFHHRVADQLPEPLQAALRPILEGIASLTEQIRCFDKKIELLARESHPESDRLRQVTGVGPLTALTYVLTLEDPGRFRKSRGVGAFLGLVPKLDHSGDSEPQLRITREGDALLRRLLISSAQYILGPFGVDCDLRRHGERLMRGGSKIAKRKAVVAVARKLAVLLHHLWVSGDHYDPHYNASRAASAQVA